ncbi:hypothetical protein LXL04_016702 [Taraxacum kok-saghyz]
MGDRPLRDRFPRLFVLDPCAEVSVAQRNSIDKIRDAFVREPRSGVPMTQWDELQSLICEVELLDCPDRVVWELEPTGAFSVASVRHFLDNVNLGDSGVETRWNNFVPKKLNVLLWRIARDRIPTRLNLYDRGVDLDTLLCPVFRTIGESSSRLFSLCPELAPLWSRIAGWWAVGIPSPMSIASLVGWADVVALSVDSKKTFDAVVILTFWIIWCYRNKLLFGTVKPKKEDLFDDIRLLSYFWINNRRRNGKMCWDRCLRIPSLVFSIM